MTAGMGKGTKSKLTKISVFEILNPLIISIKPEEFFMKLWVFLHKAVND